MKKDQLVNELYQGLAIPYLEEVNEVQAQARTVIARLRAQLEREFPEFVLKQMRHEAEFLGVSLEQVKKERRERIRENIAELENMLARWEQEDW